MNYTLEQAKAMPKWRRHYLRKKGHTVPMVPAGTPKGYKQTAEHIRKKTRTGENHPNWVGDAVSVRGGRTRALRQYPNIPPCVVCGNPKSERHHLDENTANNAAENIVPLCRKCHMEKDGRLDEFKKTAIKNQPKAVAARWR